MQHLRNLKSLAQMSGGDRLHLFSAFLILLLIRISLWLLPFRAVLKLVEKLGKLRISQRVRPLPLPTKPISHTVWMVNVSSRYTPGGAKCLARALTTKVLLNQQGYLPDLRIGVTKAATGNLEAHAWVEYQDRVVIGQLDDLSRYLPLPSLQGVKL